MIIGAGNLNSRRLPGRAGLDGNAVDHQILALSNQCLAVLEIDAVGLTVGSGTLAQNDEVVGIRIASATQSVSRIEGGDRAEGMILRAILDGIGWVVGIVDERYWRPDLSINRRSGRQAA